MNSFGRDVPSGKRPFVSSHDFELTKIKATRDIQKHVGPVVFWKTLHDALNQLNIQDGATISFHHHLRNGDFVINMVCEELSRRNLHNLTLAPSSIFPAYEGIAKLVREGRVSSIYTSYMNGPVSELVQQGNLKGELVMQTHGGRARSISTGELQIDYAFLATPAVDSLGNGIGTIGKSACGSLGYAIADLMYSKHVILVSDTMVDSITKPEFQKEQVDGVIMVDSIGDAEGIVSGTTKITRDPIGLKIAKDTANLLFDLGIIQDGFSMQTGAGGTSLAVTLFVRNLMMEHQIKASFACGGITNFYVQMLEEGLVNDLYDVQCFDLDAVRSIGSNPHHHSISASKYANPYDHDPICNHLDFVILGATEIDVDFNVNVTTDSFGRIIGGSGGHSDIAYGSKCSVVVSQLIKSRLPIIKKQVLTISTPGEDVDIFVCERGIAINPKRDDLIQIARKNHIPLFSMNELLSLAHEITGVPNELPHGEKTIGVVQYRDGTVIDSLYMSE